MSLFRRENESPNQGGTAMPQPNRAAQPAPTSKATTCVAAGSKVTGEIAGSTALTVDGVVEGRLTLENDVTVGSSGLVKGEITARSVRIGGKVKGNIHGLEMIEILAAGSVEGDVRSPRVVIADGAFFKGKVEMGGAGAAPAAGANKPSQP